MQLTAIEEHTFAEVDEWTSNTRIGIGHWVKRSEWNSFKDGISIIESEDLFQEDIEKFVKAVNQYLPENITQNQFDAAVILAFDIGLRGFVNSSVVAMINNPKASRTYSTLQEDWMAWGYKDGERVESFMVRRKVEWGLYQN